MSVTATLVATLTESITPLTGSQADYDPLIAHIGDAAFVLLGEASHGTREFYRERTRITKRLMEEKGFTVIALEADWPDASRVNRYVHHQGTDATAHEALGGFRRFPRWMWRNKEVVAFIEWVRAYNRDLPADRQVGVYGLDLYSLQTSMAEVLTYLDKIDPEGAKRARYRYSCFDHYGEDAQAYGYAASFGLSGSCEEQVVRQLVDLHTRRDEYARRDSGRGASRRDEVGGGTREGA
ncbi:MAG TPA: erythromycin esterase family protein, partial [Nitrospiraceae bacterium]|nr:erythromycin esterase family protein [Nitrospiraceae bacterium]